MGQVRVQAIPMKVPLAGRSCCVRSAHSRRQTEVTMRRMGLAVLLAVSLITPLWSEAQLAGKVYRVGILGESAEDPSEARLWQAFRSGRKERGWIEGNNILIESRWAEGNPVLLRDLAADLVRS